MDQAARQGTDGWERLWQEAEHLAREHAGRGGAVVMLDEVQHHSDWPRRLKGEWAASCAWACRFT